MKGKFVNMCLLLLHVSVSFLTNLTSSLLQKDASASEKSRSWLALNSRFRMKNQLFNHWAKKSIPLRISNYLRLFIVTTRCSYDRLALQRIVILGCGGYCNIRKASNSRDTIGSFTCLIYSTDTWDLGFRSHPKDRMLIIENWLDLKSHLEGHRFCYKPCHLMWFLWTIGV